MSGLADTSSVQFGQAVNEIVFIAFDTVIHAEVDDLHVVGNSMAFHEFLCIAMSGTEEQKVDAVQRELVGETHIGFSEQSAVNVSDQVAGVAGTIHKCNLGVRVIQQQTNQFACRISRTTDNSDLNNIYSSLWLL